MIVFRLTPHKALVGNQMAEVWRDGEFVAGVYPHQDGIRVVSKYMTATQEEPVMVAGIRLPAVVIKLAKKPTW